MPDTRSPTERSSIPSETSEGAASAASFSSMRIAVLLIGVPVPENASSGKGIVVAEGELRCVFSLHDSGACGSPIGYDDLLRDALASDLVITESKDSPDVFPRFRRLIDALSGHVPVIVHSADRRVGRDLRSMFDGSDRFFSELMKHLDFGLFLNTRSIAMIASNNIRGSLFEIPHPNRASYDGPYMPVCDVPEPPDDGALRRVGVMFSSLFSSAGDTAHIDALISSLRSAGLGAVPVFYTASAFSSEGVPTPADVISRYMLEGGRPAVSALLLTTPFSITVSSDDRRRSTNLIRELLDVPVFNILSAPRGHMTYSGCIERGVRTDVRTQTCLPEMDGQIITFPVSERSGRGASAVTMPVADGIDRVVRLVDGWTKLSVRPNREKRVAVLVYQTRPDPGHIGKAAGLDTPASLMALLERLRDEGYDTGDLPGGPEELVRMMVSGISNDADERSEHEVRISGTVRMDGPSYRAAFDSIPGFDRDMMIEGWGPPPGDVLVSDGNLVVPGFIFGNVFVGYQPMRGGSGRDVDTHDTSVSVTHQYLAFYAWIREVFHADAVIHLGTHGSLEWLPGKSIGMSAECFPEMILGDIPNICPYIMNDPGEGIQARRRSCAVLVSHLPPSMMRSGTYGPLAVLSDLLDGCAGRDVAGILEDHALMECIRRGVSEAGLAAAVGLQEGFSDTDLARAVPAMHGYISDVEGALIKNGLHILGRVPEGEDLDDLILACLPASVRNDRELEAAAEELMPRFREAAFEPDACRGMLEDRLGDRACCRGVDELLDELIPGILSVSGELDSILHALDGGYVLPSRSGSVTKGDPALFPTGRNMYGIDPRVVPTRPAWVRGMELGERMVERYVGDKGEVPGSVSLVLWATDVVKNGGDDVAMALYLLGVRPQWNPDGVVSGLEVIPIEELGRPRIDVTVRITGLFRDMFDALIGLIDKAVGMVASLDESDEENRIRQGMREDIAAYMEDGIPEDRARRDASVRVFGPADGTYGFGMDLDHWCDLNGLAADYVRFGGFGFSGKGQCIDVRRAFHRRTLRSDALFKDMTDREIDALDTDDVYGFLGGLMAVQRSAGMDPVAYIGDSSGWKGSRIRSVEEELRFIFHSKVNNPRYADGLERHGYRGAMEISSLMDNLFGWSATSGAVDDWMYGCMVSSFLDREETREWMIDSNPFAVIRMLNRLFEAEARELWHPDDGTLERLKAYYLEAESAAEAMGDPPSP